MAFEEYELPRGGLWHDIHRDAMAGDVDKLATHLRRGVSINLPGVNNMTAVACAAKAGKAEAVAWLCAHEADLEIAESADGWTPLHHKWRKTPMKYFYSDRDAKSWLECASLLRQPAVAKHVRDGVDKIENFTVSKAVVKRFMVGGIFDATVSAAECLEVLVGITRSV